MSDLKNLNNSNDSNNSNNDWRNFIRHLGIFIISVGALVAIGLLSQRGVE